MTATVPTLPPLQVECGKSDETDGPAAGSVVGNQVELFFYLLWRRWKPAYISGFQLLTSSSPA
jgi:hypothetical protein